MAVGLEDRQHKILLLIRLIALQTSKIKSVGVRFGFYAQPGSTARCSALFYSALLLLESGLRISTFIFLLPTWLFELTWVLLVLRVFYSAPSCRYPCLLFDSNVILLTNPVVSSDFRLFHVTQIQKVTRWNTRGKP